MSQALVASEVYDRLRQAMASDPDGFRELYRDYLTDAWQTLATLRCASEQQQPEQLRTKAHYLKGSSLVLGIRPLATCCADVEDLGRIQDFPAVSEKLAEATTLLNSVQTELKRRLGPQVVPFEA